MDVAFFSASHPCLRLSELGCSHSGCQRLIATPQWAIAQCLSCWATLLNAFSASSYQKECSRATPRVNVACADAEHDTGKFTLPRSSPPEWWWPSWSSSASALTWRNNMGNSKAATRDGRRRFRIGNSREMEFMRRRGEGQWAGGASQAISDGARCCYRHPCPGI